MIYIQLFYEFFKTGLFAIGGGMATLPFLYDMADKTGWFTAAQLSDMIAISESTPGPIGVNMATYVGYTTGGIIGGIIATIGLIPPSIIVILIVAFFLKSFRENKYVDAAFYALRPASTGLIAGAGSTVVMLTLFKLDLFKQTGNIINLFDWKALILAVIIFILTNYVKVTKKLHPVVFIAGSAIVGIVFGYAGV
ncbi:chromate transporter [Terrisporobacter sp.]|uniref:chromate transporter n=1 Tax=Terrisporobacter sp. TaxID=1965305 RepID=UPI0026115B27|nr:chromate transporter [Terrisporobacter sp.]